MWGNVVIYQFDRVFLIFFINRGSANAENKTGGRQNPFPRTIPIPELSLIDLKASSCTLHQTC